MSFKTDMISVIINSFSGMFGLSGFERKEKVDGFSSGRSSSKRFPTQTLMKELNYVVLKKSEVQYPSKSIAFALFSMQGP